MGAQEPFAAGRRDLAEWAGVAAETQAVERVAEASGAQLATRSQREQARTLAGQGKVGPLQPRPQRYIAREGTGVPMVPPEPTGRPGQDATGQATTREAKLGCVFPQTGVEETGRPGRDENSTAYGGALEAAEAFGPRLYAEAVRRGLPRAAQVLVLGDGAPWIGGIAAEHFYGATQIVALSPAREHRANRGKCVYGPTHPEAVEGAAARCTQLDAGAIGAVGASLRRRRPREERATDEIAKAIEYFQTNAERMRYARFRSQGLFVGSGVVEAGCKTIVGLRLKGSGMRWTVRGANAIIALRCADLSGRWEEFWEGRAVG